MTELLLEQTVNTLGLLLLTKLNTVFGFFGALSAGLAWSIVTALHGAFICIAAVAFEE
jgi:hypothetical protein